ncbi:probable rRNA maturation factor [Ectothiorhodosinus mongolicus]|uniref:Endoribonuclease YbeY n=1 Tax=Ectothiorhodosinus mongolicus TaxID=233100 RepID=A0A1R3VPB3_9GAMM|nr:rRNA maturation RNase YbeY [Ectothiorhodosinus mongolicus]ULX56604.1 rRNA maturation RNase YbeY [Ectothiorhodosinus mongolicus]SIT66469.1 probable rRNA maturation factor [Ectothiorhodosinus mongolicus]
MATDVQVQYALSRRGLPSPKKLHEWANLARQKTPGTVLIRVVDTEESAQLNQTYRQKSGPTNVLSFPFEAPPEVPCTHLGDLVICAPVVLKQAEQQHKPVKNHWAHLVIHGVLHLRGYDHQDAAQATVMERLEIDLLSQLGLANPYEVNEKPHGI